VNWVLYTALIAKHEAAYTLSIYNWGSNGGAENAITGKRKYGKGKYNATRIGYSIAA